MGQLQGAEQLVFFRNTTDDLQTNLNSIEGQSIIKFGKWRTVFFSSPTEAVPGAFSRVMHTRILHEPSLEIKTVARRQSPGMLTVEAKVESVVRIPLECQHVRLVQDWL